MKTKKCSKCGLLKGLDEYSWQAKKLQIRRKECKACQKLVTKAHYEANKDKYSASNRKRRERRRKLTWELRDVPCCDCKQKFHPIQMDFDHKPGEDKLGNVTAMIQDGYVKQGLEEAKKCDVVCSNCHRMRTFLRAQVHRPVPG